MDTEGLAGHRGCVSTFGSGTLVRMGSQTPVFTRSQTPVCARIQTPGTDEQSQTEIKRTMAVSQGITKFWSRSQAPRSARSQTPEAIVGQRLFAQKPAEDITWESNSNTSTESRSSYLLSRCASHVDRVFSRLVWPFCLYFISVLARLSAYKR